jgi:hypothetical protein
MLTWKLMYPDLPGGSSIETQWKVFPIQKLTTKGYLRKRLKEQLMPRLNLDFRTGCGLLQGNEAQDDSDFSKCPEITRPAFRRMNHAVKSAQCSLPYYNSANQ